MKRTHFIYLFALLFASLQSIAQDKAISNSKIIPYFEASHQVGGGGLCGITNPFAFIGGIEKQVSKHFTVSTDLLFWKTNYEYWCCDFYSKGEYQSVIPSIKLKFDPGKQYKGFFVIAGIGYSFTKDRGTEQSYVVDASSGVKSFQGSATQGNWDINGLAESISWGFSFKIAGHPVSVINSNYLANAVVGSQGISFVQWSGISTAVGIRLGLSKATNFKSCEKNKNCHKSCCGL